ncbi:MAG: nuclear transport factor 2 family protein [Deltaproteobacteria bacterium]|nr:nuclear transport factor 2 family protein [Deltaproteobacteria bacterium]
MSEIEQFAAYAAAFEKAYEANDWAILEPFFHEDAVYVVGLTEPLGGTFTGRDAILEYFDRVLNNFDRRFATRTINLIEGPRLEGGSVWIHGGVTYTAADVPDVYLDLEETVEFDGGRIRRLEDIYKDEVAAQIDAYLEAHSKTLGIEL